MDNNENVLRDLTVAEVAQELHTTRQSVYNWIKAGRIAAYSLSVNGTRIRREELERFKRASAINPEQEES